MKNQKGFSLVEMLAVLMISTVVLVPMMFSLTNNLEINHRLINRNAASLVSETTIIGFDMMDFTVLEGTIDTTEYYVEYNKDSVLCTYNPDNFATNKENEEICGLIFNMKANNITFDADEFRVFVYPYNLTPEIKTALVGNLSIPIEVRNAIQNIDEPERNLEMLRITVWIKYGQNDRDVLVRSGVISRGL